MDEYVKLPHKDATSNFKQYICYKAKNKQTKITTFVRNMHERENP